MLESTAALTGYKFFWCKDLDKLKLKDNADRYMDRPLAPPPMNTFRDITNEFFEASESLLPSFSSDEDPAHD
jgi:hypothetical protein